MSGLRSRLLVVAALLGCPAALVVGAPAAGAATDLTSGSIVYAHGHNIWLSRPDGQDKRPLTTDGTAATPYHSPSQSAEGNVVVAVQDRGQNADLVSYVYELDRQGALLRAPFAPAQYAFTHTVGGICDGASTTPEGITAKVSPDGARIAIDKLASYYLPPGCGSGGPGSQSEVYVIGLDGAIADDVIAPNPGSMPLSLTQPSWVTNTRLVLYETFHFGLAYHDHGSAAASSWMHPSGLFEPEYTSPALSANQTVLATTGVGQDIPMDVFANDGSRLRLWTTNGAIPAIPTPRCDIQSPDHLDYDPEHPFAMTDLAIAPDGGGVAWVEEDGDMAGAATATRLYVSPIGDLGAGDCASLDRRLLVDGGSEPSWGAAAVGPAGSSPNLPTCPAGQTGTPPDCVTPPATCPSGQTGTPPDCVTPPATCPSGQTGTPPDCVTPPATCPSGQTGTPPDCVTPPATCPPGQTGTPPDCVTPPTNPPADPPPAVSPPPPPTPPPPPPPADSNGAKALVTRVIKRDVGGVGRGCSRSRLKVSGRGVTITAAKPLAHGRCRLKLRVSSTARGRRNLVVKNGRRKTTLTGVIRL